MKFQSSSLIALAALAFLSHAPASGADPAEPDHHLQRSPVACGDKTPHTQNIPGSGAGSIYDLQRELQLLHSETLAFKQWMNACLGPESGMEPSPAIALLRQEIHAYEGRISAWLDSAISAGGVPPSSLASSNTSTLPAANSPALPSAPSASANALSSFSTGVESPPATSAPPASQSTQHSTSSTQASSNQLDYNLPTETSLVTIPSQKPTDTKIPASSTVASSASALAPPQPGSSSESGNFDAQSSTNVAVYYGQTRATARISLSEICKHGNVDIVILAFVTDFFGPGGFPTIDLKAACYGHTPQMKSAGATGLLTCPDMAYQIKQCQGLGKKVLLSLGGSKAKSEFPNDLLASDFANQLWDLFGAGTGVDAGLRPFGDVTVDGFDVDNEDNSKLGYSTFVSSLRQAMNTDSSKTYYISAAPSCIRPAASIPLDAMQTLDFVFVQFYGSRACNVGGPGFMDSFKAWSSDLSANGAGPKLYIGAPGCEECAETGYVDAATMASTIASAKDAGISNFGGIMLWDGPMAVGNVQDGKDYTAVVKDVLI